MALSEFLDSCVRTKMIFQMTANLWKTPSPQQFRMTNSTSCKMLYLPDQSERAPKAQGGVYAFRVVFPSDLELGLRTLDNLDSIRANIASYTTRLGSAFAPPALSGALESDVHGLHLRQVYSAVLVNNYLRTDLVHELRHVLDRCSDMNDVLEFTRAIRSAFRFLNPVYVGMCTKRSFHSRLQDHLSGRTGLQQRLLERELRWTDLSFEYYPLSSSEEDSTRGIERIVQMVSNPICSQM